MVERDTIRRAPHAAYAELRPVMLTQCASAYLVQAPRLHLSLVTPVLWRVSVCVCIHYVCFSGVRAPTCGRVRCLGIHACNQPSSARCERCSLAFVYMRLVLEGSRAFFTRLRVFDRATCACLCTSVCLCDSVCL